MTAADAAALRVEAWRTLEDLEASAAAWDELAASMPQGLPMTEHAWISTWLRHYLDDGTDWVCLMAWEGTRLRGVLPVVVRPVGPAWLGLRRAEVPCHFHTALGDVVLDPASPRAPLLALLAALRREVRGLVALDLGAVRFDAPSRAALDAGLPGWVVRREHALDGPSILLDGPFETWLAGVSGNMRKMLRKRARRLEEAGHVARLEMVEGDDVDPAHVERLLALEAAGWKGREGTAILSDPRSAAKHRELVKRFHARGQLAWQWMWIDDDLAAAHLVLRCGPVTVLLKHTYDERWKDAAPGNALLLAAIEHEFARGRAREITGLVPNAWNESWNMVPRPYEAARLVPRGLRGLLAARLPGALRRAGVRLLARRRGPAAEAPSPTG